MEIKDICEQVDIVDYISQYIDVNRCNGDEYVALCPFHNEKTPSLTITRSKGLYYCFGCGARGDVMDFEKNYNHISLRDAIERVKTYAGISDEIAIASTHLSAVKVMKKYVPKSEHKKNVQESHTILDKNVMEQYEWKPEKFKDWIAEGIPLEQLDRFQYRYDALSNRIVHPIRLPDGRIFSICGRTLDPEFKEKKLRKYTYLVKLGVLDTLFGLYENREEILKKREIILFEGAKSVMKAASYGFTNCCAVLTSHINPYQTRILLQLGVRIVVAFDEDVDPRQDAEIKKIKRFCTVEWVRNRNQLLDEKMAPVDAGKEVWNELYGQRERLR